MADRKRLTDEAIAAALIKCGSTKKAAEMCGCTARTIIERKKQPSFIAVYDRAKAEILHEAAAQLQGQMKNAAAVLSIIMSDDKTPPQTRINAATAVLQYGIRLTESIDILDRISALEEATNTN